MARQLARGGQRASRIGTPKYRPAMKTKV